MKNIYSSVACGGMDVHYKFSAVTFRNEDGRVVRRERIEHPQRDRLWEHLNRWPRGLPVVLEASFGWGWLSDLLSEAGLEPHLSNCYKLEQMRKARGWVKTNKKDADNHLYYGIASIDKMLLSKSLHKNRRKRKKCYLTVDSLSWIGCDISHHFD